MDETFLTAIAARTVEVWLLSLGFQPTGYFDPNDRECIRDYGPHRVYTVQARVPDGFAVDRHELLGLLQDYLEQQARLPSAVRFRAYNIETYFSPYCGNYIFASIEHTA